MATKKVTANTAAQTLFATPLHKKGAAKSLQINNQAATAKKVRLQDIFTPDASNGVASPTEQTIDRLTVTIAATTLRVLNKDELEGLEFLGTAKAIADGIDTACEITIGYDLK